MNRRPSIELTNLQSFVNPLDQHIIDQNPLKPPAYLNSIIKRVQQHKQNIKPNKVKINPKLMKRGQKTSKIKENIQGSLQKEQMEDSLFVFQFQENKQKGKEQFVSKQDRSLSLPGCLKQTSQAFRIHHHSSQKNQRIIGTTCLKSSSKQSQRRINKHKTQYLNVKGITLITSEQTQGKIMRRYRNSSDSTVNQFRQQNLKNKKSIRPQAHTKSHSVDNQVKKLMNRAKKIVQSHSLFKLPKDKNKILEVKLRSTISSDLESKKLNQQLQNALGRMVGGRINFKPLSTQKYERRGNISSKNKEWKPKQAEQLAILRGRIIEKPKEKLMLR